MKNSIDFEEDDKRESESNWHMGLTSTPSFDTIGSRGTLHPHNLQILSKKEILNEREVIPGTFNEKLSFYRAFASSRSKTQFVSMEYALFNKYLWFYICNVFFKSLPSTYVYVFLSSYTPEEHFFVSKMVPIFHGYVWYCITGGFFSVLNFCAYAVLLWDYVVSGFIYKNPWNRCDPSYNSTNLTCYDVSEFTNKIENETVSFETYGYAIWDTQNNTGTVFQLAQLLFLQSRMKRYSFKPSSLWIYESALFLAVCLFYRQLFKKYIWKIFHCCQCALILVYLTTFCHLIRFYFINGFTKIPQSVVDKLNQLWNADVEILAESMACPPLIHILSARDTEKPKPSRHSTLIVVSNAIYYVFRGLLSYLIKRYCESLIGVSLLFSALSPCSNLFFWPVYFSYFYLGDYYTLLYLLLHAIEESLLMAITLYCLIEAIACEWRWMKPWCIAGFLCMMTFAITFTISENHRGTFYLYITLLATTVETVVIFVLYPMYRLIDDITFHHGVPPSNFRLWNLRMIAPFYLIKVILMFKGFMDAIETLLIFLSKDNAINILYVQVIPFLLGAIYAMYDILYRKKEGCSQLFVPLPEWGSKDLRIRQLRNLYDSREYIGSQAPRELSRYFIEKTELTTYQVDILYDNYHKQRGLSELEYDMTFEDEKKSN